MTGTGSESGHARVGKFADDILVCCPRCGAMAHVIGLVRLACPSCNLLKIRASPRLFGANGSSFERAGKHLDWHGAFTLIAARFARCGRCGNALNVPKRSMPTPPPAAGRAVTLEARCEVCAAGEPVEAIWVPECRPDESRDPAFGCALYLKQETARGSLWAYNGAHAKALLDWISSSARSRDGDMIPDAMASRLPGWMKSATNRPAVKKALGQLVARAEAI